MYKFNQIAIIVKPNDEAIKHTLIEVYNKLKRAGVEIFLEHSTQTYLDCEAPVGIEVIRNNCDLAIVIGGDGTLLHAARELVDYNIPLIGINRGRLGFLVDLCPDKELSLLEEILTGKYLSEERFLLEANIIHEGKIIAQSSAFNDVVVRIHDILQIMDFEVTIDDSFVNQQRADGIIIATPSGSTAYSLSNGGPILNPSVDAIVLQPICPHTLSSRALVVNSDSVIKIHILDKNTATTDTQVVCDGQVYLSATLDDTILVKRKEKSIVLLHPEKYNYHEILRKKLKWG